MEQKRRQRQGIEDRWHKRDGSPSANYGKGKRYRARYVDPAGREVAKAFALKREAAVWLANNANTRSAASMTLADFYREWEPRQLWAQGTRNNAAQALASFPHTDIPLSALTPSHVQAWIRGMQQAGLQPSTIRSRFASLRRCVLAAMRERDELGRPLLTDDPTAGISLPRQRRAAAAMQIPTPEDVGRVMDAAEPEFAALIAVAAFAGLRRGELSGVQVGDIDFLKRELHVRRQVQWAPPAPMEIKLPKAGSERTVSIPQALVDLLAQHIAVHNPGTDPARWLFPGARGGPLYWGQIHRKWHAARKAAKVTHNFHTLRHFYASGLINQGLDVVTVQRALGHANAAITLRVYSHLWPNADDRTRDAAAVMMAEALGGNATEKSY